MADRNQPSQPDQLALLIADVYEAAGVLRRWGEQTASVDGQTQARWQVLSVLSEGDWTVPRAAERLGTSRQAVQKTTNDLLAAGLAELVENPRHQLSPFVRPTARGRKVLRSMTARAARMHTTVRSDLDDVDLRAVRSGLHRLVERVRLELEP